jgi:chlorite dismutase
MSNATDGKPAGLPPIDVNEYGGKKDGERQAMDRRLFMQLLVFDAPEGTNADAIGRALAGEMRERNVAGVIYADAAQPRGLGLLTWAEDPSHFVTAVRPLFSGSAKDVTIRPDFTMFGRTYSLGYEPDLEDTLFKRPVRNALNEKLPWHIWYPLRRTGAFAKLSPEDHGAILREHAQIGFAYGQASLAHDIRLACHALDADDNEFLVGLVSDKLHPLSHLVQTMRKTRQTSEFIQKMGPFFVGYAQHRVSA